MSVSEAYNVASGWGLSFSLLVPPQYPVSFSLAWNFSRKDRGCCPNPTQLSGFCSEGKHLPLSNAGRVSLGRWAELLPVGLTQRREEDCLVAGAPSKIHPLLHFCCTGPCSRAHIDLPHGHSFSFLAPSFSCLLFLITFPFLPTDLQASCQVPLSEAGACSLACCCLLVGHELWTVELQQVIAGHWPTSLTPQWWQLVCFSNLHW